MGGGWWSAPGGTRTHDLRVKSPLLYQLSYRRVKRARRGNLPVYVMVVTDPARRRRYQSPAPLRKDQMAMDPSDIPLIRSVLVVDDAGVVRRLSFRVLSESGFRVFEAASAVEALEVLAMLHGHVDLVLVDVVMPEVNGVDLVRLIRERWDGPAILFMSAHPAEVLAREGLKDLRVQFLAKPFTRDELLRAVQRALTAPKPGAARRQEL